MSGLAPPKANISPLIRFARWTALFTGIIYGVTRHNYLAKREVGIQQHENELREKYRQRIEKEKKQKETEEMNSLGKEAGVLK